jgi:molybdopterin-binding protein
MIPSLPPGRSHGKCGRGVRLVVSITTEAAAELGLAEGMDVVAIVKASDVIVGVPG